MSYIRSTSNPEGLYVFGGAQGVEWYERSRHLFTIPYDVWDLLVREYIEQDEVNRPDLIVRERVLDGNRLRVVLRWQAHEPVEMWDVTWECIISRYRMEHWAHNRAWWRRLLKK